MEKRQEFKGNLAVLMAKKDPHLTRGDLRRVTGLSFAHLGQLYSGRPMLNCKLDLSKTAALCKFLGCRLEELIEPVEVNQN